MQAVWRFLKQAVVLFAIALLCASCNSYLASTSYNPWQVKQLSTEANLLDLSFSNPQHGWVVGGNSTIFETKDGGENWQPVTLDLGEQSYRFTSVSFSGKEGWVTGQPAILLHTTDEGKSWLRVPLSEKLPGSPNTVFALGQDAAEMTTDVGAIYRTADGGRTWKAMVGDAFGVIRNIAHSPDGKYVAVSARGNFYSIWEPGQNAWMPFNRNSSRRVQNMGFTQDGRLWMLARGGQIQFSRTPNPEGPDDWEEPQNPEFSTSWGLLDLAYRTPDEVWVTGGSGNLLCSFDGGKTWQKDRSVENIPSNLYRVIFLSKDQGFIIGQQGTLLRYQGESQSA